MQLLQRLLAGKNEGAPELLCVAVPKLAPWRRRKEEDIPRIAKHVAPRTTKGESAKSAWATEDRDADLTSTAEAITTGSVTSRIEMHALTMFISSNKGQRRRNIVHCVAFHQEAMGTALVGTSLGEHIFAALENRHRDLQLADDATRRQVAETIAANTHSLIAVELTRDQLRPLVDAARNRGLIRNEWETHVHRAFSAAE